MTEMPVSTARGSPAGDPGRGPFRLRHRGRKAPATRAAAYHKASWIPSFKSDQQMPPDSRFTRAALVPKFQRLEREGRHLHASEDARSVLKNEDEVLVSPNIDAG